jgi:protein-L-isoaspartate(D-aspartate) O-methyltransferase
MKRPQWPCEAGVMVSEQLRPRGIQCPAVLQAMEQVPRHLFVGGHQLSHAYEDRPLPIGRGQTISQPYVVAAALQALERERGNLLEVGCGCGYLAAVAATIGFKVTGLEIISELAELARTNLTAAGFDGVEVICANGREGYSTNAPYDCIVISAATPHVPEPLLGQLALGGKLIAPLGDSQQVLSVIEKLSTGLKTKSLFPVRYVPLTG